MRYVVAMLALAAALISARAASATDRQLAHDPEKCERFSVKIMREIKDVERASVSMETDRALVSSVNWIVAVNSQ
jgi:hypothetical protein